MRPTPLASAQDSGGEAQQFSEQESFVLRNQEIGRVASNVVSAEEHSAVLLRQAVITREEILSLVDLLPLAASHRNSTGEGQIWSSGSYVHGGINGILKSTHDFPLSTKALCKYVSSQFPGLIFSSVAIIDELQSSLHKDVRNHKDHPNCVCPLSQFSGGEVWVHDEEGAISMEHEGHILMGKLLPVNKRACLFSASKLHCVMPWKGRRCVLVAFCARDCQKLSDLEAKQLHELGFQLPNQQVVHTGHAPAARAKAKPLAPQSSQTGVDIAGPFCIELCSGTAGLTAAIRKAGLRSSFGIDHVVKAGSKAPIIKLDATKPEDQAMIKSWLESPQCLALHCGVPCGTSSRAREINNGGPRPLRSDSFPEGIPGLTQAESARVCKANSIYSFACCIILCVLLGVHWSIEQPLRSIFWLTKYWRQVLQHVVPYEVIFHSCMFGGMRPKATKIMTSMVQLCALSRSCDHSHPHLAWGKSPSGSWATSSEVEYPHGLCKAWADILVETLQREGRTPCDQDVLFSPDRPSSRPENQCLSCRNLKALQPSPCKRCLPGQLR